MGGALEGVRVLELASVVLGPWACQTLGDLGADVVKVEPPGGDSNRQVGPARHVGMGALYLGCNRNKRSLVLDLRHELGRRALLRLAAQADVLVHNYRPATLRRLGLEYAALRAVNPRLIVCATCGFGRGGPYAERAAYDDIVQAASGLARLPERLGAEPAYAPTIVADKTAALAAVGAICAALYRRERTGEGQELEVPMYETLVWFLMAEHLAGHVFDPPSGAMGYARLLTAHRRPYRTRDGWLAVLPYLDRHWQAFCEEAGRSELATDPRFATLAARSANVDALYAQTAALLAGATTAEWLARLHPRDVPVAEVADLESLWTDPHLRATGFWQECEHPSEGRLRLPGVPMRFSATPGALRRSPPRLGEHSREVLLEGGLGPEEIQALVDGGLTT